MRDPDRIDPDRRYHIACDLDGTLAEYDGWRGIDHIGEPIAATLAAVKAALAIGWDVSIFTARVAHHLDGDAARRHVEAWVFKHVGVSLPVVCIKHGHLDEFWDDKAVRIRAGANVIGGLLWDRLATSTTTEDG